MNTTGHRGSADDKGSGENPMKAARNTRNTWTVKVDGEITTFTKLDVALYFGTRHGKSGLRTFGSVRGDWRMIDKIANDAQAYFDLETP